MRYLIISLLFILVGVGGIVYAVRVAMREFGDNRRR